MTGMTTRAMPVMVVENRKFGNRAYCTINEGLGKVMRFGGNDAEVLDAAAPGCATCWGRRSARRCARAAACRSSRSSRAGLGMGDEMHQRNVACSGAVPARDRAVRWRAPSDDGTRLADAWPSSPATTSSSSTSPWRWARR